MDGSIVLLATYAFCFFMFGIIYWGAGFVCQPRGRHTKESRGAVAVTVHSMVPLAGRHSPGYVGR